MIRQGKLSNYGWSMKGKKVMTIIIRVKKKRFLKTDADLACLIKV